MSSDKSYDSFIDTAPEVYSCKGVSAMVFNATFNNISAISWRSVLLLEETGVPVEKTTDLSHVTD